MFWLWMSITSFTPDSQITVRELLIPFESREQCEAARTRAVSSEKANIGKPSDLSWCVTISNDEEFLRLVSPWPENPKP